MSDTLLNNELMMSPDEMRHELDRELEAGLDDLLVDLDEMRRVLPDEERRRELMSRRDLLLADRRDDRRAARWQLERDHEEELLAAKEELEENMTSAKKMNLALNRLKAEHKEQVKVLAEHLRTHPKHEMKLILIKSELDAFKPKPRIAKTLSIDEFSDMFPTEDSAVKFVEGVLWGSDDDGSPAMPVCPGCGGRDVRPFEAHKNRRRTSKRVQENRKGSLSLRRYRCRSKKCRKEFSIRTGNVFEHGKLPLRLCLWGCYHFVTDRGGTSSMELSKKLGVPQVSTLFLLHKLRMACGDGHSSVPVQKFSGTVAVDEVYNGGLEKNKHHDKKLFQGRGGVGKIIVLGIRCIETGRLAAEVVPDRSARTLTKLIRKYIEPGSTVFTDEHKGYRNLAKLGYIHRVTNHKKHQYVADGGATTNSVESVWANLERGFIGVYHTWSRAYVQFYVDEYVFRLNEGRTDFDVIDRIKALIRKSAGKRLTYKEFKTKGKGINPQRKDARWVREESRKLNERKEQIRQLLLAA